MIIVYPMLTSNNVSANILPAICKSVEKYILVYKMEDIINQVQNKLPDLAHVLLKIASESKIQRESRIVEQGQGMWSDDDQDTNAGLKSGAGQQPQTGQPQTVQGQPKKDDSIKIQSPSKDVLSLEPTWVKIDTPKGSDIIGIKVIPYVVKSDQAFSELLISDRKLYGINRILTALLRQFVRMFWSFVRGTTLPIIGRIGMKIKVSGDPKKDIIYASTEHGRNNIFACLNFHDVPDEYFNSAKGVSWLFKLGWGSFIVCDDVDRKAFFCMREFGGLTSVVPYQLLYTSIGKDYAKVYDDLEELKKTSSPFFRFATTFDKAARKK